MFAFYCFQEENVISQSLMLQTKWNRSIFLFKLCFCDLGIDIFKFTHLVKGLNWCLHWITDKEDHGVHRIPQEAESQSKRS